MIETLVSVAIIAILTVLLMAAIGNGVEKANLAKCTGNLRQIGAAFLQYAVDNEGSLPPLSAASAPNSQWYVNALTSYLPVNVWRYSGAAAYGDTKEGVWRCPTAKTFAWGGGYGVNETHLFSYGAGTRLVLIDRPSKRWLIGDAWDSSKANSPTWTAVRCPLERSAKDHEPATRHRERCNVCFLDGHVETWRGDDLMKDPEIFCHGL